MAEPVYITTVEINSLPWKIYDAKDGADELVSRGDSCYGVTDYIKCTIHMLASQGPELYRQTLIHELTHAVIFSYGQHLIELPGKRLEEGICDFLAAHADQIVDLADAVMAARAEGKPAADKTWLPNSCPGLKEATL